MICSKPHGVWTAFDQLCNILPQIGIQVVKNRIFNDDSDVVHLHSFGPIAYLETLYSKKPVVATCHVLPDLVVDSVLLSGFLAKLLYRFFYSFYNHCDLILAPTPFVKASLKRMAVKQDILTISNGVNTSKFKYSPEKRSEFRKKYGITPDEIVVYSVGQIISRKGIDLFIRLAKLCPTLRFLWIGKNPFGILNENRKSREILREKPDNVIFTGYVEDIVAAHSAGDIFLFPSYSESQGIALLEAASCGKPLVVRDLEAYDGWLFDRINCLKSDTLPDFRENLTELTTNKKLYRSLAENSIKLAEDNNLTRIGNQTINAYNQIKDIERRKIPLKTTALDKLYVFLSLLVLTIGGILVADYRAILKKRFTKTKKDA